MKCPSLELGLESTFGGHCATPEERWICRWARYSPFLFSTLPWWICQSLVIWEPSVLFLDWIRHVDVTLIPYTLLRIWRCKKNRRACNMCVVLATCTTCLLDYSVGNMNFESFSRVLDALWEPANCSSILGQLHLRGFEVNWPRLVTLPMNGESGTIAWLKGLHCRTSGPNGMVKEFLK